MTKSASWVVGDNGQSLLLQRPNGEPEVVSHSEIWDAEFGGADKVRGYGVSRPSSELPSLEFERGFRDLWLSCVASEAGQLFLSHVDETGAPVSLAGRDHLISSETWFPVDRGYELERELELRALGIELGARLRIGDVLALAKRQDLRVRIDAAIVEEAFKRFIPQGSVASSLPQLYPYQSAGVHFLTRVADESLGAILGDEMGLGKTLQVIALLDREVRDGRSQNLIICPATLVRNWEREFAKFAPALSIHVHAGGDRSGIARGVTGFDVVITTFETLVRDFYILSSIQWNVVAVDEAQGIKNSQTKRAIAAKGLPRRVAIAVTGTPVENSLTDLWSLMDFAVPGYLGDREDFESDYSDDLDGASEVGRLVSPLMIRRLVADVAADLPEKISVDVPLRMSAAHASAYESARAEGLLGGPSRRLALMTELRLLCIAPVSESDQRIDDNDNQKLQLFLQLWNEILTNGGKALVFSSFNRGTEMLLAHLAKSPDAFVGSIDGSVPMDRRQDLVDRFNDLAGPGVLVINPQAGGTGLNLQGANHVIHFNPVWNPAVEDQATARAYRRGQTRPVVVHRLYYEGSVEEVMVQRLAAKRDLSGRALEDAELQGDDTDLVRALSMSPLRQE